jgi:hypothetical protein
LYGTPHRPQGSMPSMAWRLSRDLLERMMP